MDRYLILEFSVLCFKSAALSSHYLFSSGFFNKPLFVVAHQLCFPPPELSLKIVNKVPQCPQLVGDNCQNNCIKGRTNGKKYQQ